MSFEAGGQKEPEEFGGIGEYHLAVEMPAGTEDDGPQDVDPDVEIMREELARERRLRRREKTKC